MSRVALLGLGAMGSRMAAHLAAAHQVVVWNRTSSTADAVASAVGASVASTPAEAAIGAEVVIAMVADDDASEAVWFGPEGALDALGSSAVMVEASTITAAHARRLGEAAAVRGVAMVEAPVVGSRPQAEAGALVSLVGGDTEVIERVRPVLETYSGAVRPTGGVSSAATMKLAINGLFAMQVAAFSETVGMLERAGVDASAASKVLGGLPITAPGLARILGLIADREFSPNFPVALVAKDLRYLAALAADVDGAMPMAGTAAEVFASAVTEGHGALDIAGVAARYLS